MDDNRKLHLANGETIPFPRNANIIFEVEDVAVASPATISRCGIVLLEPKRATITSVFNKWKKNLPEVAQYNAKLLSKLDKLFEDLA